jgi:hypothetical protein
MSVERPVMGDGDEQKRLTTVNEVAWPGHS